MAAPKTDRRDDACRRPTGAASRTRRPRATVAPPLRRRVRPSREARWRRRTAVGRAVRAPLPESYDATVTAAVRRYSRASSASAPEDIRPPRARAHALDERGDALRCRGVDERAVVDVAEPLVQPSKLAPERLGE